MNQSKFLNADVPTFLFNQGNNFESQNFLGSHLCKIGQEEGVLFRVWAPKAKAVSVIGDFNKWDCDANIMKNTSDSGIWQCFVPGVREFNTYKYCICTALDAKLFKADPYAVHCETRPANCSKVYNIDGYEWGDNAWQKKMKTTSPINAPLNIYEMHLGSWRMYPDGNPYSYTEMAKLLIPYIKEMGYTHIEIMPIAEYSQDNSWGYQTTGYFAPTSRFGTPKDFMRFVDECHKANIGVIMDWVPAYFPKDEFGLYKFDGSPCYEDADPVKAEDKELGIILFDFAREQVQSFLISNALYWLNTYHIDGLRIETVARMLYLDYNRKEGEWHTNKFGKNENLDAIDFLQKLNKEVLLRKPNVLMIAQENSSWPKVTSHVADGGLGFNLKWNLDWKNDLLSYMSTNPLFRAGFHSKVTSSFSSAFTENFVLALSHDEVVNGKCSLINKMSGEYEQKFAGLRTLYGYMMAHPGKKMLFMGQELAQFMEWSEARELDWGLLQFEKHSKLLEYVKALNGLYKDCPALWEMDFDENGFEWIVPDDSQQNIVVFLRRDKAGDEIIAICNFAPVQRDNYCIGVPHFGMYRELLNSDREIYGGFDVHNDEISSREIPMHGKPYSISITIAPLSTMYFKIAKQK